LFSREVPSAPNLRTNTGKRKLGQMLLHVPGGRAKAAAGSPVANATTIVSHGPPVNNPDGKAATLARVQAQLRNL